MRYWLNPKIKDQKQHAAEIKAVCDVYAQAPTLADEGVRVMSCDEKTSVQALERDAPTKPMKPGLIERQEFEYVRHGTACLIANLDVATGKLVAPSIGPTRNEADFAMHIARTIASDPDARWIFVLDNLTTHLSETLVRFVAVHCGLDVELGVKGKCGILKNVASRRAFLVDRGHSVSFIYTPKHSSWINQIECWFSILARRVLRRGSFSSVEHLEEEVLSFIAYFNKFFAKPLRWTYAGKVLAA